MVLNETPYANSVFEQPWWLDIVAPGNWDEVYVKDNDQVIARLAFVLNRKKIIMPDWTQTLGIWMRDDIKTYKRGNSHKFKQKEIIFELFKQLPNYKFCKFRLDSSNDYVLPFRWLGFNITPTFSYRINFNGIKNLDNIKDCYSKHIKRDLNSAKKKIVIQESFDIDNIIELQDKTFKRQKRKNPLEREITSEIIKSALTLNRGRLTYGINSDNKIINGTFSIYDSKSCYYLMAYNDPEYQNSNTLCLLTNDCIEFAFNHSDYFDFEGSMVEGIENFYRAFGSELVTNYLISKQSFLSDCKDIAKPRIKKILGYRI